VAVAAALAALGPAPGAAARGDEALARIHPRVDRRAFTALLDDLRMDDDQRLVAGLLYSDYATGLEGLAVDLEERLESSGRQRVGDALAGKIFIERAELRRLRVGLERAGEETWERADALASELVLNTRSLLDGDDVLAFDAAVPALRRAMYLHPRQAYADDAGYAGDGVDVVQLAARARQTGGELDGLDDRALAPILATYERELDAHLAEHAAAERRARTDMAIARIERDRAESARLEQEMVQRWKPFFRIQDQSVRAIAALAEERLGAHARVEWLERFDEACFPRLFRDTKPDREAAWIASRGNQAAQADADVVHRAYRAKHRELAREAITLTLGARLTHSAIVDPRMDASSLRDGAVRDLHRELIRNSGRRTELEKETTAALEALLTDRQRKQMLADIAAAAYGRRTR
jgi:hypothetical protein